MRRLFAAAAFLLAFAGAAHWVLPAGKYYYTLILAQDDAARLADLQLAGVLDAGRVEAEIATALDRDDTELATSFLELADSRHLPVSEELRARVAASGGAVPRAARDFGLGLVTGEVDSQASLAGSIAGDLTVWGDVRDLGRQAIHWARGEPVDEFMVALAGAGIVATGATYVAFGAPLTLRAGLSVVKGARRAGALGGRFAAHLIDAARSGRKVQAAGALVDVGRASTKAGTRATLAGLTHVDDAAGAARLARLAEVKGGKTLAIVKVLGRGALFLTEAVATLAFWVIAALVNLIGLISSFNAFVVALLRPLWKRPRGALA
ncbi:hypothetical protein [Ancylobacter sp. SL191]|uniref:hypothetical protein n=1 Tax=Ancylobacter sp. SL191 TaxID=2995166 RepID=UPI00226E4C7D|nr:hypothetical protein [Ancylobacter sp. SL191]WAC26037.1 hypothetical protein OU996_13535 [Ancylobacter sp. SL191]